MKKTVKTIVFPVGGLGTRFLPATKATPKEMLPVAEKPLIQYAFEEAMEAGIEKFIFITGRNKNPGQYPIPVNFIMSTIRIGITYNQSQLIFLPSLAIGANMNPI